jgi:hypothetical protein
MTTWVHVKQSICKAAQNVIGVYPKGIRNGCFIDECKDVLEAHNTACMKMVQRKARTSIQAFRNAQRSTVDLYKEEEGV